jgi:hypothetical protein
VEKPTCSHGHALQFLRWSRRYPPKSEALAICPEGCGRFQIRYWQGQPTSEPYQIRKVEKPCRGSYRLSRERKAEIVAQWGSVQNYLDYSQVSMSEQ